MAQHEGKCEVKAFQKTLSLFLSGFNFICQIEAIVNDINLSQCPEMLKMCDVKWKIPTLTL